jgi:hypothetical protein
MFKEIPKSQMNFSEENFSEKNLIKYMESSVPDIRAEELAPLKAKKEASEPEELDVDSLAHNADAAMKTYEAKLADLPDSFKGALHNNIVQYFLTSADRFDKNGERGLNKVEFDQYSRVMLAKLDEIVTKYTQAAETKRKSREQITSAMEAADRLTNEKIPEFNFDEKNLDTPEGIATEMKKLSDGSDGMHKIAGVVFNAMENFDQAYLRYKKEGEDGSKYLRKFVVATFNPEYDKEANALEISLQKLKRDVVVKMHEVAVKKFEAQRYGEKLNNSPEKLRQGVLDERDNKLQEANKNGEEIDLSKQQAEKNYALLKKHQAEVSESRTRMLASRTRVADQQEVMQDAQQRTQDQTQNVQKYDSHLVADIEKVDTALKTPDLPEEQRRQLEEKRAALTDRQSTLQEAVFGGEVAQAAITEQAENLGLKGQTIDVNLAYLDNRLEKFINPGLLNTEQTIISLEAARSENLAVIDSISKNAAEKLEVIDDIDKIVADNVMDINLGNEQLTDNLQRQQTYIDSLSIERPTPYFGALAVPLEMVGDGLILFGKGIGQVSKGWII